MNTNTTDKVQVGESTTGTSTSTTWRYPYTKPRAEQGWECPRCGRINAPWKSQCDCDRNNCWTITDNLTYKPYNDKWQKYVYCDSNTFKVHPETTTWKAPSSVCRSDSTTCKPNGVTTAWSANSAMETGGSDYWNSVTRAFENVPKTYTNQVEDTVNRIDHITTTTYYNTGDTK